MVKVIIFLDGTYGSKEFYIDQIKRKDVLIAVDGGSNFLHSIKKLPDMLIGDLDSIDKKSLSWIKKNGIRIIKYSRDKDYSDFELALREAMHQKPQKIVVFGAFGKRIDHEYSSMMIVSKYCGKISISLDDEYQSLFFAKKRTKNIILCRKGDTVSLIPFSNSVKGITSHGLKWALKCETIFRSKSRTLSNIAVSSRPYIYFDNGLLLVAINRK